jgi:tRNA pseudouridine38-40 synthase
MRNIRLILSYDGTDFSGWQYQPDARTVQGVVEEALGVILAGPVRIGGAGRTDAGVHALGQAAGFRTASLIQCPALFRGLNALLPRDVRVLCADDVPDSFDVRRSAILRIYRYLIYTGPVVSPFMARYAWHISAPINGDMMNRAGSRLVGTHDFQSFASSQDETMSTVRQIVFFHVEETGGGVIQIEIAANAFLRHMVRSIVGTIVEVGREKMSVEDFGEIIRACDRGRAGMTAPPQGLFLVEVRYP